MPQSSLLPSRGQLQLWILLGIFLAITKCCALFFSQETHSILGILSWYLLGLAVIATAWDAKRASQLPEVTITRQIPHALAVNKWAEVTLYVQYEHMQSGVLQIVDDSADTLISDPPLASLKLQPGHVSQLVYRIKPLARGKLQLSQCSTRQASPWGLWLRQSTQMVVDNVNVYPDYSVISAYNLLAGDQQTNQLGIRKKPRRGEGLDFHQLREYRSGDSMRNIHWKASSRRNRLIAKEYQDERDQRIIILLDAGQRMRARDGDLSHFDQALNAILLVSYIALRQGDSVAVNTFGQSPSRWLPPQKGAHKIKAILNGLFDLEASQEPGDYVAAATRLCQLQAKRSLVIMVTNTRDEDATELQLAIQQLQRHHLVLLADLSESVLELQLKQPVHTLDDALLYASVSQFDITHQQLHTQLKAAGIFALQTPPHALAVKMVNHYLAIKRSGVL